MQSNSYNPFPSSYEEFIYKSRYSRWIEEEKRREDWPETVTRYLDFLTDHVKKAHGYSMPSELHSELWTAIHNLEVMPSMRSMMTAGDALRRDNVAGYNPVSGDTRVVTKEYGNVKISELDGQTLTVLNKNGEWTEATFTGYGIQKTREIIFRLNSNTFKKVNATDNHRWVLSNGEVVPTSELKLGMEIDFVSAPKPEIDLDYYDGVRHGLIYGDGTSVKSHKRVKGYHIRLCGKSAEQLEWFKDYPVCYPSSANGDPVVMLYDDFAQTHDLKSLPNPQETDSYLLGFIRGWMGADGSVSKSSQVSLCVNEAGLYWLYDNSERLGFVIQSYSKQPSVTNYGKRKSASYIVKFSRSSLSTEDFICSWKRENFRELKSSFIVYGIHNSINQKVYCAEVPDTNTFVLEGGLVTGNCAYLPIDDIKSFDEAMYILLCGTGIGFSVERQFITKLPEVPDQLFESNTTIVVHDSKEGWAKALRQLLALLYSGEIPKWDTSKVRPAGARLKTFGGRASGPQPLEDLFQFVIGKFRGAIGRRLNSLECHDILCKIGEVVVVGGVRRSAMISLSNLSDDRMRKAKMGQWWETESQRALANNSVSYTEKPDVGSFLEEWSALYQSKSGERGIFNRVASKKQAAKNGRRDTNFEFGTNPCSEIILRPYQFCNLSEIVVKSTDTFETLRRKAELASILGTMQSTLTHFPYLRKIWKKNTEEERLLGVSLTGIMDNPLTINPDPKMLNELRDVVVVQNKILAGEIGIPQSTATTCIKPSGTVSQLVNSASGIHARHSDFYIRTVRGDNKDPLTQFLIQSGVPNEPDVMKPTQTTVFSFLIKSPNGSITRTQMSAIEQLELWKTYQEHWCEHKPSITVSVKEHEWPEVGGWVYNNFDMISGISFLPFSDHTYQQAPYQDCTKEEYEAAKALMPDSIDWNKLSEFEAEDNTSGMQTLACSSDGCEVVDLT